jgi:hypothetical protein
MIDQFISVERYRSAQRVFVIVDNGSAQPGQRSIDRLQRAWPNLILVHIPVHANWLNQPGLTCSGKSGAGATATATRARKTVTTAPGCAYGVPVVVARSSHPQREASGLRPEGPCRRSTTLAAMNPD